MGRSPQLESGEIPHFSDRIDPRQVGVNIGNSEVRAGPYGENLPHMESQNRDGERFRKLCRTLRKVCRRVRRFRKLCLNLRKFCPRVPAMIAVDYERVFAEQAKKRVGGRPRKDEEPEETLPQVSGREPQSAEQAGDLFNVSGRTVRDAHNAP